MNDGRKKKPQKHKNTTAFKIVFDTQALQKQKKVSLHEYLIQQHSQSMCQMYITNGMEASIQQPARCNICLQKTVLRTYMKACQPCVDKKKICAKCLQADYQAPEELKITQKDQKQQQKTEYNKQIQFMKTLQQRSRRTVRRNLQKGKISWDNEEQFFVDEEGNKMIGLHFRKGFTIDEDGNQHDDEDIMDQDNMFGDDDQDDMNSDQEEENQNNQQQTKNQQKTKQNRNNNQLEKGQNDKENKSDVEGDEVDCEKVLDQEDQSDQDLDDELDDLDIDDQQEEQKQSAIKDNRGKKSPK